jgi:NAD(P)H-nitrite reductase large subunit
MKVATEVMPAIDGPVRSLADDQFVCQCLSVTRDDLRESHVRRAATVKELSAQTGAGTVCGGCLPKLAELTARRFGSETTCLDIITRNENVKSFRFQIPESFADAALRRGSALSCRRWCRDETCSGRIR